MKVFGDLKSAQLEVLGTNPGNTPLARIFFDSATGNAKIYTGSVWQKLAPSGGTAANTNQILLPSAATAALSALVRVAGALYYDSSSTTMKYDTGAALVELANANGVFTLTDGAAATPSLNFMNNANLGLYRVGANSMGFAAGGVLQQSVTSAGISAVTAVGSAGTPSLRFFGDLTTGIYQSGSGEVGFATNGVQRANFNDSGIRLVLGSISLPAFSFLGDTNTGIYSEGADTLNFATGGTNPILIGAAGLRAINGSAALPSFSFINDTNTGFYSTGNNNDEIGFSGGGTLGGILTGAGTRLVDGSASLPAYSFASDTNSGMFSDGADSLAWTVGGSSIASLSSAGLCVGTVATASKIKWKCFTGTTAGATTNLSMPTLTTILGFSGTYNGLATGEQGAIHTDTFDTLHNYLRFSSNTTSIALTKGGSSQNYDYTVIMFYQ